MVQVTRQAERRAGRAARRKVGFIAQMELAECGAACLAMVLGCHGHHVPLAELRRSCGVSRDGANALGLVHAARALGMLSEGRQIRDVAGLATLPLPAILHWDFNHFVVLERLGARSAVIVDPRSGRHTIGLDDVGRHFTGVALTFERSTQFRPRAASRPSLARYRSLLSRYVPNLLQLVLASLALQLLGLVFPLAVEILLDRAIAPHQEQWLWGLAFGMGMAVLARVALGLVRNWVLQGLQNAMDLSLMGRFLDHLLHLPLGFFLQREAGDLVQRVQANTVLRALFGSQSVSALLDLSTLLGYALLMLAFEWKLGLIVIGLGLLRVGQLLALRQRSRRLMAGELASSGNEEGALVNALSGLESTKALGAEHRVLDRWHRAMVQATNRRVQRRYLEVNAAQLTGVLSGCVMASVLWVGGQAVLAREMTLGVFAAFMTLQGLFTAPLESLTAAAMDLQLLGTHLRRLDDVLETPVEESGDEDPGRLAGAIELEEVSFRYDAQSPWVLHGISLAIQPGEKIAIVGRSGAGKSTLARLLLGMHLPTHGSVRFDGRDLRRLHLPALRGQIGVVLQDTFLFDDTVRANLALNAPGLPLERLRHAARLACVDDVIDAMPAGYASRVGENGNLLSGGQRQRLSLARALAHQPALLLLDEATSALDLPTEARIHANLAGLGCTRIVIAHRLQTVKDADRILVLDAGRLVQQGTYATLADQEGRFRDLVHGLEDEAAHA
jgi:ABC-type bacteriocin/lantibiotic exporter with double-glycine peptidase domain